MQKNLHYRKAFISKLKCKGKSKGQAKEEEDVYPLISAKQKQMKHTASSPECEWLKQSPLPH